MAQEPTAAKPAFRDDPSLLPIDLATGLPALAHLSRDAGVTYVAGLLARMADLEESADLLVGVHPATGRPAWARLETVDDGEAVEVRFYDGHPAAGGIPFPGSVRVGETEAAWYGGSSLARVFQAAEDVYDALRVV